MITKRANEKRGKTQAGWLDSRHSFSFNRYYDPNHMGFGSLRVINEDQIKAKTGFGEHSHRNMEIISYVLKGQLNHQDSMGNGSAIKAGDIQLMSAGTGISHSEFNGIDGETHFLQLWIEPNIKNSQPDYQQLSLNQNDRMNQLHLIVSPGDEKDTLTIKQDAKISIGQFDAGHNHEIGTQLGRKYWLQIIEGSLTFNEQTGETGDGFAIEQEPVINITADTDTAFLLFDLP